MDEIAFGRLNSLCSLEGASIAGSNQRHQVSDNRPTGAIIEAHVDSFSQGVTHASFCPPLVGGSTASRALITLDVPTSHNISIP